MEQPKRTLSAFRTLEEIKKYSSYDERRLKSREFRHISLLLNKIGFMNSPLTLGTLSKKTGLSKHVLRKHISSLSKAGLLYRIVYSYKSDSYIFITGYKGKDFYSLIEGGRIGILSGLDKLFGPERKMKIKDFLNADISRISFSTGNTSDEAEILKILHDVHRVLWTRRGSVSFNREIEEEANLKKQVENLKKEEENNILTLSNGYENSFNAPFDEDRTNVFLSDFFVLESHEERDKTIEKEEEATMELRDVFGEFSKKEKERNQEAVGCDAFTDEENLDYDTFEDEGELNHDDDCEEGEGQYTIRYISFRDLLGKKEKEPEYIPPNVDENGKVSYISAREMFDFFKKERKKREKDIETMERELDEIFGYSDYDLPEEESQAPQKDTLEELQELFRQLIEVSKEKKKYEKELKEKLSKPQSTVATKEELERLKNIVKDWKEKTSYIKEEESKLEKRFVFSNELREKVFAMLERINELKRLGKIDLAKEEYKKAYEFLKQETGQVFIPREWDFGKHVIDPLDPFEWNEFNKHDYYYVEMFKNKLVHNFFGGYRFFQRLALKQLKEEGLLKGGPLDDPEYAEIAKIMGDNDEDDTL
jgi:DNA-binding MarR family transcriptional regulator